jgi:hypothetical protein
VVFKSLLPCAGGDGRFMQQLVIDFAKEMLALNGDMFFGTRFVSICFMLLLLQNFRLECNGN